MVFLILGVAISNSWAQEKPTPERAFLRSMIVPGWGHYYADSAQWTRGKVHLGTEMALIVSYFGFSIRANNLIDQYETLASLRAGVDISNRSRSFKLAIGNFNSLQEYNQYQLRSRNWNRLYKNQFSNQWTWDTQKNRDYYKELRSDVDQVKNQLPAILGLMVVNRVVSAISAYNQAKKESNLPELAIIPLSTYEKKIGIMANLRLQF